MTTGFPPAWAFLAIVFIALCTMGVFIAVLVVIFRAASKSSSNPNSQAGSLTGAAVPPVLGDDSLTNPANPLYHIHHPGGFTHDASAHQTTSHSPSFDSSPSPSPSSFDSGSSMGGSFDSGSSSCGSTSDGSGCG
ncbi:MAG: hypothetical protein EBS05_01985 [Proteobacteria bacterium]|nr:hypothetical protein [Pseudomonadota bacterium]